MSQYFLCHQNQLSSSQSNYRFHQGSDNIPVAVWVCRCLWHSPCFITLPSALFGFLFLQVSFHLSSWNCWHKHAGAGAAVPLLAPTISPLGNNHGAPDVLKAHTHTQGFTWACAGPGISFIFPLPLVMKWFGEWEQTP